jgi:uncharacterized protein with HEPN domain
MSENRLIDYIGHMLEAAQLACSYLDGLNKGDFLADRRTQQAVILNIVVIGEAATKLAKDYPALIDQYPDVPWKNMKGMRNRIAHSSSISTSNSCGTRCKPHYRILWNR